MGQLDDTTRVSQTEKGKLTLFFQPNDPPRPQHLSDRTPSLLAR